MFAPDVAVLNWLVAHRGSVATRVASLVMSAGTSTVALFIAMVFAGGYVVVRRRWQLAVTVVAAVVGSFVITEFLKRVITRPRPPAALALVHVGGFSMPSTDGAVTAAAGLAVYLASSWADPRLRRACAMLIFVGVVMVGICLLYLGAHWTSDVVAGWLVGAASAWFCHRWAMRLMVVRARI